MPDIAPEDPALEDPAPAQVQPISDAVNSNPTPKQDFVTYQDILGTAAAKFRLVQHNAKKRRKLLELAQAFCSQMQVLVSEDIQQEQKTVATGVVLTARNVKNTEPGPGTSTRLKRSAEAAFGKPSTRKRQSQSALSSSEPSAPILTHSAPKQSGRPRRVKLTDEVEAHFLRISSIISQAPSKDNAVQGSQLKLEKYPAQWPEQFE